MPPGIEKEEYHSPLTENPVALRAAVPLSGVAALRRWTGKIAGPYGARLALACLVCTLPRHVVRNAG